MSSNPITKAEFWAFMRPALIARYKPEADEAFTLALALAAEGLVHLADGRGDEAKEALARSANLMAASVAIMAALRVVGTEATL
jgi:hypothetical protein